MVRLRLQRHGRKKRPYYYIVAADQRSARDGRIIEDLGRYNPLLPTDQVSINTERALYWLETGAQPSDTVRSILKREGILYRAHLRRWGKSEDEIEVAINEWKAENDGKTVEGKASRREQLKANLKKEEEEYNKKLKEQVEAELKAEEEAKKAAEAEKVEAEAKAKAEDEQKADDAVVEQAEDETPAPVEASEETPSKDEAVVPSKDEKEEK